MIHTVPLSFSSALSGLFVPLFLGLLHIPGIQLIDAVLYGMYYALLRRYGQPDEHGHLYITVRNVTVAKHLNTSPSTIKRAKKRLQEAHLIRVVRVGCGRTSRIYLYDYRDVHAAHSPEIPAERTVEEELHAPLDTETVTLLGEHEVSYPVGVPAEEADNIINNPDINMLPSLTHLPENVALTPEQYAHLGELMGAHRDPYIRHYAKRKEERGYTFSSDYDALINWWASDRERWIAGDRRKEKNRRSPKPGDPGFSFDEDDFFASALERSFGGSLPPPIIR